MSKKTIISIIIIAVGSLLFYLGFTIINQVEEKNQVVKRLEVIPKFEFLTLEQQPFTKANLKQELKTVFIYFNSECDYCQHEAQSISENIDNFKNTQIIFISTEPTNTIQQFSKEYNLDNQQKITFLYDNLDIFSTRFGATSIPYLLIYDNNQNLIKQQKGQLNAQGILKALQQND